MPDPIRAGRGGTNAAPNNFRGGRSGGERGQQAPPPQQPGLGDILRSFAGGAYDGPGKAVHGVADGAAAVWQIIKALPDPKAREEMRKAFANMSPHERQQVVDGLSEAAGAGLGAWAGGTSGAAGGAFAFGLGAVPGAAAGATVGAGAGGATGRFISRLMAHWTNPEGIKGDTAADEARGYGEALTGNATMEGAGRAVGVMGRAAKSAMFKPTGEAARVADNARKIGVPQSLGVATGNKTIQKVEAALAKHPFSSGIIMDAKKRAQEAFEGALQNFMGDYHPSQVGPEAFQDAVERAMGEARKAFQGELQANVKQTASRFGPAKTAVEAGEDLQRAHLKNEDLFSAWKNKAYPALYEEANRAGVSINPQSFSEAAGSMLDTIPAENRGFFPSKAVNRLEQASAMRPEIAMDAPAGIQTAREAAQPMLLQEAVELRSQLYDAMRRMGKTANPKDREVIGALASQLNQAIEDSMKADHADIYGKWRDLSEKFKAGHNAITEPVAPGRPGNPMARQIRNAKEPEKLVTAATDNPSRVAQTELATGPDTITRAVDPAMQTVPPRPAADSLRRNVFDATVDQSAHGAGRVSPSDLNDVLTDPRRAEKMRALFGDSLDQFTGDMGAAAPREAALYDSKLGRVLDQAAPPSSQSVMDAAFPRRNAAAAEGTLDLFPVGPTQPGAAPMRGGASRAFVEDMTAQSTRHGSPLGRATGDGVGSLVDPRAMTREFEKAGKTVPAVLGEEGAGKLRDILQVGRSTFAPELLFGNPSGTAPMQEMFRLGKRALVLVPSLAFGRPGSLGQTAAALGTAGAMRGAAKLVTSPRFVDWAIKPVDNSARPFSRAAGIMRSLGVAGAAVPAARPQAGKNDFIESDDFIEEDEPQKPGIPAARKLSKPVIVNDDFIEEDVPVRMGVPAARRIGQ